MGSCASKKATAPADPPKSPVVPGARPPSKATASDGPAAIHVTPVRQSTSLPPVAPMSMEVLAAQTRVYIGDVAPDFTAQSTIGPLRLYDYIDGKWCILISHPQDFSPVSSSELRRLAQIQGEFDSRQCRIISISCDRLEDHQQWKSDIERLGDLKVKFPIVSDPDRSIAVQYGMLDSVETDDRLMPLTVGSVFFINPMRIVKAMIVYPATTGRNFTEIIRVLDSLQVSCRRKLGTPADWSKGAPLAVMQCVSDEEAKDKFGEVESPLPYMRVVTTSSMR